MRSSSIILLSGGLDSLLSLHWAKQESDVIFGLTFDYGQKAAANELSAARKICEHYDIQHKIIALPWYGELNANALLSATVAIPLLNQADLNDQELTRNSAQAVWVPNRNGIFLNIAACFAEDRLANWLVVGFNSEEAQTFPDNSKNFVQAMNRSLEFSTRNGVQVCAPMVDKTKKQMVELALKNNINLSLIWSCYSSGATMCGQCESCQRLRRALTSADAVAWLEKIF